MKYKREKENGCFSCISFSIHALFVKASIIYRYLLKIFSFFYWFFVIRFPANVFFSILILIENTFIARWKETDYQKKYVNNEQGLLFSLVCLLFVWRRYYVFSTDARVQSLRSGNNKNTRRKCKIEFSDNSSPFGRQPE